MRILLINQYAGAPSLGMEYRPHWMATEWQKLGHEVLIVTGEHSHLRAAHPPVGRSTVEGVEFLTLPIPRYKGNGARRFANILAFRFQLRRSTRTLLAWCPDAVIASSTHPMDVRPSLRLARMSGAAFVHEVHDLWPLTPRLLGGMSERHPMIMWMQREEDLACREADVVVSMLPATLPYLQSRGLDPKRWVHVSNGVPPESVVVESAAEPSRDGWFRVGYFGAHGHANDLSTLVEASRILGNERIEFHLWGSGPLKADLQRQAEGLQRVHFHDHVGPAEARTHMATMDALYIGLKESELFVHGVSPNKMFDYMAAARPIIQAMNAPSSPAERAGCAVLCEPGDPGAVARSVLALAGLSPRHREAMGNAGRDYVLSHATYTSLASSFIAAIEGHGPRG